jgi:UDP-N-acetylglucosamine acyltransferase
MPSIHPTAQIDPSAWLDEEVTVGPYCIIGSDVRIGRGTRLEAHSVIEPGTSLGCDCRVRTGAVLGGPPQHQKYNG